MTYIEKGVLAGMADDMRIIRRKCPATFIYGRFLGPSSLAGIRDLKVAYDIAAVKLVLLAVL